MSCWEGPMVRMLRYLIGDEDGTTYSDAKLKELIIYSAYIIQKDLSFNQSYTINLSRLTISPDPIDTNDVPFINLSTMKAACTLSRNQLKAKSDEAVKWKDGQSSLDTTGVLAGQQGLTANICQAFEDAKLQATMGDAAPGKAILGPWSSDQIQNWPASSFFDNRDYRNSYF